jgi:hypothetical protein
MKHFSTFIPFIKALALSRSVAGVFVQRLAAKPY